MLYNLLNLFFLFKIEILYPLTNISSNPHARETIPATGNQHCVLYF
jgi:hypothetical protein